MLADFFCQLLWGEAHGSYVIGAQRQLALWRLHELHSGTVAIRDVHHGKSGVWSQVAHVVTCAECIVEDLNGIICEERGSQILAEKMIARYLQIK